MQPNVSSNLKTINKSDPKSNFLNIYLNILIEISQDFQGEMILFKSKGKNKLDVIKSATTNHLNIMLNKEKDALQNMWASLMAQMVKNLPSM